MILRICLQNKKSRVKSLLPLSSPYSSLRLALGNLLSSSFMQQLFMYMTNPTSIISKTQGAILAVVALNLNDIFTIKLMKKATPKNIIVSKQPITRNQSFLDFSSSVDFICSLPTMNSILVGGRGSPSFQLFIFIPPSPKI